MKKQLQSCLALALGLVLTTSVVAQKRYYEEIFDDSQIEVISNVVYGINVDFLRNTSLLDPTYIQANAAQLALEKDSVLQLIASGNVAGLAPFYDPSNTSTLLKITGGTADVSANPSRTLLMDVYKPIDSEDTETERPVIVYIHTGNFLPPVINGGVGGSNSDSAAVEFCRQWAKRGYVAIAPNYRHGWNPTATGQTGSVIRRATLLNAVYRAIHDVKRAVRVAKAQATTFGIDPNNVALFGQGSGGYVALAYNTLDRIEETEIGKFLNPLTGDSYINPTVVGDIDGLGGLLNLYGNDPVDQNVSASITAQANIGGALASMAWMGGAKPVPMITAHCIRDPFAPFDTGQVIVPTTGEDVVPVPGPASFMPEADNLGVNDVFKDKPDFNDPYTFRARELYDRTYDHFNGTVTIDANSEGLLALELPLESNQFENQGAPWEWWSLTDLQQLVAAVNASTGGSYDANAIHQNGLMSNPDMSKTKALAYIDSIQGYLHPRLMLAMGIGDTAFVGEEELGFSSSIVNVYPNPATASVQFNAVGNVSIDKIEMYDLTGKAVLPEVSVNGSYYFIDLGSFDSGMYIVRMHTSAGVQTERLVVE